MRTGRRTWFTTQRGGVTGKAVSHTGPVRGIRSTLLNQVPINDIEPLTGTPYSDAIHRHVHRKSDHTRAETHMHTLQNACGEEVEGKQDGWRDRLMKRGVNRSRIEEWGTWRRQITKKESDWRERERKRGVKKDRFVLQSLSEKKCSVCTVYWTFAYA